MFHTLKISIKLKMNQTKQKLYFITQETPNTENNFAVYVNILQQRFL